MALHPDEITEDVILAIEEKAVAEYRSMLGKVLRAHVLDGYDEESSDNVTIRLDPPALVRVIETPEEDVRRWGDEEWLDPWWNVEVLEDRPELEGLRGFYVYGNSWSVHGEHDVNTEWELAE